MDYFKLSKGTWWNIASGGCSQNIKRHDTISRTFQTQILLQDFLQLLLFRCVNFNLETQFRG